MKKEFLKIAIAICLVLSVLSGYAQQQSAASSQTDIIKTPKITSDAQVDGLLIGSKKTIKQYYDGLNRNIQSIDVQGSPTTNTDLIGISYYNERSEQTYLYLPYSDTQGTGMYRPGAINAQSWFYQASSGASNQVANEPNYPYKQQLFESSPLERLIQTGDFGTGYQLGSSGNHWKTVNYRNNLASEGVLQLSTTAILGTYQDNKLTVVDATDEDGDENLIYADYLGHTILKRQLANQTVNGVFEQYFDTYYLYSPTGKLINIIPPKASQLIKTSGFTTNQTAINNLIFTYQYDSMGRLTIKTVPVVGPTYIIYDPFNRPLLIQDANQRNKQQWSYFKYDINNRIIAQGIYTDNVNLNYGAMQSYIKGLPCYNTSNTIAGYETRGSTFPYYTNTIFPTTNNDATQSPLLDLAYAYYDDYDYNQDGSPDYQYKPQGLANEETATTATNGLTTCVVKRVIGSGIINTSTWLANVVFYDIRGNIIQDQSNNQLYYSLGRITDVKTIVPDFAGKPLLTKVAKVTGTAAGTTITVTSAFTYDNHDKLLAIDQTYNNQPSVRIAAYVYNSLGQLVKKNLYPYTGTSIPANITWGPSNSLTSSSPATSITASSSISFLPGPPGSTGSAATFTIPSGVVFTASIIPTALQSVDYRYNIRGQLTSINNSKLTNDGGVTNTDLNDLFGMQIMYDQPDSELPNAKPFYNGKISAVKWMTTDGNGSQTNERSYVYNYDLLDRLTSAVYDERLPGSSSASPFNINLHGFDESGISYDENSNIQTLNRNASALGQSTNSQVDQLVYSYSQSSPNELLNVSDNNNTTNSQYTGNGFRNLTGLTTTAAQTTHYQYDPNGNLTVDPYKGLALGYNVLNKIDNINFSYNATGRYINYAYDGSGQIARKQQYDNSQLVATTDYIDGFVYVTPGSGQASLSYFPTGEGRVVNTSGSYTHEFIIADQQGNARFSFQPSGNGIKTIQENSYYPFGMVMSGSPISTPTLPNKQLYNDGSEWQNDYSNLPDYYQTFYRNYDAAIGRWIAPDPKADKSESLTNYHYAENNPINNNDPNGDDDGSNLGLPADNSQGGFWGSDFGSFIASIISLDLGSLSPVGGGNDITSSTMGTTDPNANSGGVWYVPTQTTGVAIFVPAGTTRPLPDGYEVVPIGTIRNTPNGGQLQLLDNYRYVYIKNPTVTQSGPGNSDGAAQVPPQSNTGFNILQGTSVGVNQIPSTADSYANATVQNVKLTQPPSGTTGSPSGSPNGNSSVKQAGSADGQAAGGEQKSSEAAYEVADKVNDINSGTAIALGTQTIITQAPGVVKVLEATESGLAYSKTLTGVTIAQNAIGAIVAGMHIYRDYNKHGHGIHDTDPKDRWDLFVGSAGVAAAIIFEASNPVGWAIGVGTAIYFTGRFIHDQRHEKTGMFF